MGQTRLRKLSKWKSLRRLYQPVAGTHQLDLFNRLYLLWPYNQGHINRTVFLCDLYNTDLSPHTCIYKSVLYSGLWRNMAVSLVLLFSLFLSHSTESCNWWSVPDPALLTEEHTCLLLVIRTSIAEKVA